MEDLFLQREIFESTIEELLPMLASQESRDASAVVMNRASWSSYSEHIVEVLTHSTYSDERGRSRPP